MKFTKKHKERQGLRWRMKFPGELYWVRHKDHTDPYTEGYIGVALSKTGATARVSRHLKENTIPEYNKDTCVWDVLATAPASVILQMESTYRPLPLIGWNGDRGGAMPREWLRPTTCMRYYEAMLEETNG